ncbi:MAG TPA: hypothetical protein VKI99_01180 [Candidatus Dormibacteraeota bacterium]|nr:hypothetical protein [Candidatus Dormibacteraeota bacterium]
MHPAPLRIGGFEFACRQGRVLISSPAGSADPEMAGFLRGTNHLLTMGLDLEGEAELDGGLVFRVEGPKALLRLGPYSEAFALDEIERLFKALPSLAKPASEPSP